MASNDSLWDEVAEQLRAHLNKSVWLSTFSAVTATCTNRDDGSVLAELLVPSAAVRDRINSKYLSIIQASFDDATSSPVDIMVEISQDSAHIDQVDDFVPDNHLDSLLAPPSSKLPNQQQIPLSANPQNYSPTDPLHRNHTDTNVAPRTPDLNSRYTFDTFVIGSSNRFAHAAALAVAETPSRSYNPLFIHGHAGLGKTHLLQAIAHYVKQNYPHYRVCYVTTETLLSELVDAIMKHETLEFKRRYRENDVLLIDDIQFLKGKNALQEELFHTFNDLHQANRQIVLSSDRPPDAIATLEDRLRSRFKQGLLTDIQPPDIETRLAILRSRSQTQGLDVDPEILEFIASNITDNIRELEGALNRAVAWAQLHKTVLSLEQAREVLADLVIETQPVVITPELILDCAANYFGFEIDQIIGSSRKRPLVNARQIAMYVMRTTTSLSLQEIGVVFGGKDHSTVIYAVEKIAKKMQSDQRVYNQVNELNQIIKTGKDRSNA